MPGRWAFTLLELLLVIAILALLITMLAPSLATAKLLAKSAGCAAYLRTLGIAAASYQSIFNEHVPICWRNLPPDYPNPWKCWRANLMPYAPGLNAFNCPAASGEGTELFRSIDELLGQDWYGTANAGSYGVMYQFSLPTFTAPNSANLVKQGHPVWTNAFSAVPGAAWSKPSESVYAADARLTNGPIAYPTRSYKGMGTSSIVPPSEPDYSSGILTRRFADRHGGTNYLFVDGHVAGYPTSRLDTMTPGTSDCIWDVY